MEIPGDFTLFQELSRIHTQSVQKLKLQQELTDRLLLKVVKFCDNDESVPETLHNSESPSRQNKYCYGRSAWEVMRETDDFRGGRSLLAVEKNYPKDNSIIKSDCLLQVTTLV